MNSIRFTHINPDTRIISSIIFSFVFLFTIFSFMIISMNGLWVSIDNYFLKQNFIYSFSTKLFYLLQFFVDIPGFLIISIFLYNFFNSYKCVVFTCSYVFSQYISSILQLMFNEISSFPFESASSCLNTMGNPNRKSIISVVIYLTLWKILTSASQIQIKKRIKLTSLIIFIEMIVLLNMVNLFSQNYAFHQVLLGMIIGGYVFYLISTILKVEMNSSAQMISLIKTPWYYIFLLNGGFALLLFLSTRIHSFDKDKILERLQYSKKKSCETFSFVPPSGSCERIKEELIINASFIFINVGLYIALRMEYHFLSDDNSELYGKFNFNHYKYQPESFYSELIPTKNNQWNNTNVLISIYRLIIAISMLGGFMYLYVHYIVGLTENFYIFLIELILFANFIVIVLFFFMKLLFKHLRLINNQIYQVPLLIVRDIDEDSTSELK